MLLAAIGMGQRTQPSDWVKKRGTSELIGIFTASRDAPDRRRKIAKEIHARRPANLAKLLAIVKPELERQRRAYLTAFYQGGQRTCAAKARAGDARQIAAWRKALADRSITVEALKATSGPAMKGLRAAVTVTAAEILAKGALPEQRRKLMERLELYEWCRRLGAGGDDGNTKGAPDAGDAAGAAEFTRRLERDEGLLAMMSLAATPADRTVLESNWKLRDEAPLDEVIGVADVNVMRILIGLRAARIDPKLCNAARGHSADMNRLGFFSHTSPVPGKASPWARAKKAGTSANGECIYRGNTSPQAANQSWFFSPGHHTIMFSTGARRLGMGRDQRAWTLMTGR